MVIIIISKRSEGSWLSVWGTYIYTHSYLQRKYACFIWFHCIPLVSGGPITLVSFLCNTRLGVRTCNGWRLHITYTVILQSPPNVQHYLLPEAPEGTQTQIWKEVYIHVKINKDMYLVVTVRYPYMLYYTWAIAYTVQN